MATYTSGDWHAKSGLEKEFMEAWREMATWSATQFAKGAGAKLFQDKDDPTHFTSLGEWGDAESVEKWRASDGFRERMANVRELLDDVHLYTVDMVVEVHAE